MEIAPQPITPADGADLAHAVLQVALDHPGARIQIVARDKKVIRTLAAALRAVAPQNQVRRWPRLGRTLLLQNGSKIYLDPPTPHLKSHAPTHITIAWDEDAPPPAEFIAQLRALWPVVARV